MLHRFQLIQLIHQIRRMINKKEEKKHEYVLSTGLEVRTTWQTFRHHRYNSAARHRDTILTKNHNHIRKDKSKYWSHFFLFVRNFRSFLDFSFKLNKEYRRDISLNQDRFKREVEFILQTRNIGNNASIGIRGFTT